MLITLKEDITELGKFQSRNSKISKGEKMSSRGLDSESWACVGDLGEQNSPISRSEEKPESYIFKMD